MSEQQPDQPADRGAAEEATGVPATPSETGSPSSPSSGPGGDASARGDAEDKAGAPRTE